jgi:hypothetical protein
VDEPFIAMLEGRFNAMNMQSSSARAPPRECPTYSRKYQIRLSHEVLVKWTMLTSVTVLALY